MLCGREQVSWSGIRWVCMKPAHAELVRSGHGDRARFTGEGHVFVRDRREPQPKPVT